MQNLADDTYVRAALTALLKPAASRALGSTTRHSRVHQLGTHSLKNN